MSQWLGSYSCKKAATEESNGKLLQFFFPCKLMINAQKRKTRNSVNGAFTTPNGVRVSLGRDSYVPQVTPDRQHATAAAMKQKSNQIKFGT